MMTSPQEPIRRSDRVSTILLRTVFESWKTMFSRRVVLVRLWHQQLATSLNLELSMPDNLEVCRNELITRMSEQKQITPSYFFALERQSTSTARAISLWNIVWFNVMPGVLVLPWAVQRIPHAFNERPGMAGAAMLTVFAAFAFFVFCYFALFIQSRFLPAYSRLVNRLTQPKLER